MHTSGMQLRQPKYVEVTQMFLQCGRMDSTKIKIGALQETRNDSVYRLQSVSAGGVSRFTESGLVLATDHSIFQTLHYFGFSLDFSGC